MATPLRDKQLATPGIITLHSLYDAAGVTAVDSAAVKDGTYSGSYVLNQPSLLPSGEGSSVHFTGGKMAVPDVAGLRLGKGPVSIECFMSGDELLAEPNYALWDNALRGYSMFLNSSAADQWLPALGGNTKIEKPTTPIKNTNYHIVLTSSGTEVIIYVRSVAGGLFKSVDAAFAAGANNSNDGVTVAGNPSGGGSIFKGFVQNFAVYNVVLTPAIVDEHWAAAQPFVPAPITRERPPDKLAVRIDSPNGNSNRWAEDEGAVDNVLSDLEFSDEIPGGNKELSGTLARDPKKDYRDLGAYGDIKVYEPGGEVVWQGSLDKGPTVSGEQFSISPSALGYQYILDDDQAAQVGFIDCDLSKWGEGSSRRKILNMEAAIAGRPYRYTQEFSSLIQDLTYGPGIMMVLSSVEAGTTPFNELIYYGGGPEIGGLRWDYRALNGAPKDANMSDLVGLGSDDLLSGADLSASMESVTALQQSLAAGGGGRKYALVQSRYLGALEGKTFTNTRAFLNLKVLGRHGLVPLGVWPNIGFSAKQMVEYLIKNFAAPLTVDPEFIDDDGYVITQAWYSDGQALGDIMHDLTKYGLYDWFVYNGKRMELRKPGTYGRFWKAYVAESGLNEVGLDSQRLWRKITVRYTDASGVTRTAGAPGSGCDSESALLEITDPDHPAVKAGRTRRDILDLQGIATPETAVAVGKRFLEEANLISRSGSATLKGYVFDDKNVLRPVAQVHSGDYISFVDASDKTYRKIMAKTYRHTDRSAEIDVDAPPGGMDALLERLQAGLITTGVT
jgi:hypothetical protein